MSIDMTLHKLLNQVKFDKVFSDILCNVPEVENKKARFRLAFDTLLSVIPARESDVVIEVQEQDYLGKGVHGIWINTNTDCDSRLWERLLAGHIRREPTFKRLDTSSKITNEMIVADLLWLLASFDFPKKATAFSGFLLNNRRQPKSSLTERIEEICSYINLHQISEISHEDIYHYRDAGNLAWIANLTSYSLPRDKSSYDMICFLDDFMWFNNETKTFLIISSSEGYENEASKIAEFANSMLKNPTIVHGKPLLPGIEIMAIFITE